ncbi:hypothetical protein, partial [uncultured Chryseobacterium sp.]|uniref:hypothetical protein n=1 Tax=uncultured Chryseobacterium sp. TaxID=259322 RepID=UPI0025E1E8B9
VKYFLYLANYWQKGLNYMFLFAFKQYKPFLPIFKKIIQTASNILFVFDFVESPISRRESKQSIRVQHGKIRV